MVARHALFLSLLSSLLSCGCTRHAEATQTLTRDAFFQVAGRCRAANPVFFARYGGRLPAFSFQEGVAPGGEPVSRCLAAALKSYRYDPMSGPHEVDP